MIDIAPYHPRSRSRGTFQAFLDRLLAFESGIDPALFDWYRRHEESPLISYPRVEAPGRVIRDPATGQCVMATITVKEYFDTLGVGSLFDPRRPDCIRAMQYAATNALGFIGYQVGESLLIETGFYRPVRARRSFEGVEQEIDSFYVGAVDAASWRGGCREVLHRAPTTNELILAADVNRWDGQFTGRHGICGAADLKVPENQELLVRQLLEHNHALIRDALLREGIPFGRVLGVRRRATLFPYLPDIEFEVTTSGLLAGAHLSGAEAVAQFLRSGVCPRDEFGTPMLRYLVEFGNYETPFN